MPRPPKPTALKVIEKTTRADRRNNAEPTPPKGRPPVPAHLSKQAKAAFVRFVDLLDNIGVLTLADATALERLCDCYATIIECQERIEADGRFYETVGRDGARMIRPHPATTMLADADRRLMTYLGAFGMTPAARARVHVADKDKQGNLDEYFGGD